MPRSSSLKTAKKVFAVIAVLDGTLIILQATGVLAQPGADPHPRAKHADLSVGD